MKSYLYFRPAQTLKRLSAPARSSPNPNHLLEFMQCVYKLFNSGIFQPTSRLGPEPGLSLSAAVSVQARIRRSKLGTESKLISDVQFIGRREIRAPNACQGTNGPGLCIFCLLFALNVKAHRTTSRELNISSIMVEESMYSRGG